MASLESVLGREAFRVQGVGTWSSLSALGRGNVDAIARLVQEAANEALADGDRARLDEVTEGLRAVVAAQDACSREKPILPRLRRELFRVGEPVWIYLGELPATQCTWVRALIHRVEKAFRREWQGREANSGYYWRVSATLPHAVPIVGRSVAFSTTEPRVLQPSELRFLLDARTSDPGFVAMFSDNARRDWQPLWYRELGLEVDTASMSLVTWLGDPTLNAVQQPG